MGDATTKSVDAGAVEDLSNDGRKTKKQKRDDNEPSLEHVKSRFFLTQEQSSNRTFYC